MSHSEKIIKRTSHEKVKYFFEFGQNHFILCRKMKIVKFIVCIVTGLRLIVSFCVLRELFPKETDTKNEKRVLR